MKQVASGIPAAAQGSSAQYPVPRGVGGGRWEGGLGRDIYIYIHAAELHSRNLIYCKSVDKVKSIYIKGSNPSKHR